MKRLSLFAVLLATGCGAASASPCRPMTQARTMLRDGLRTQNANLSRVKLRRAVVIATVTCASASVGCGGETTNPTAAGSHGKDDVAATPVAPPSSAADPSSSPAPVTTCNGSAACERAVFVMSGTVTSNLAGLEGADAKCTAAALAASSPRIKGRVFAAWLSSDTVSAKDRLVHGTAAYVRPDGVRVAADWNSLVSATHEAPIAVDENGVTVPINTSVWTATDIAGNYVATGLMLPAGSCLSWGGSAGSSDFAQIGEATARDIAWTRSGAGNCYAGVGFNATLYCFER